MDAYIAEDPNWRKLPTSDTVPPGGDPGEEWATTKILSADGHDLGSDDDIHLLDSQLADAVGEAIPLLAGQHNYSSTSFPALFSSSSVKGDPAYGWHHSLLNVKCNWNDLADGSEDAHIASFINSIPDGHKVYLLINHEPENDGPGQTEPTPQERVVWCTGQARAANLIASINDPRCEFGICHMAFTWDGSRDPEDYNPVTGGTITMTQQALDRTIFAPDGYTKVRNPSGTTIDTMDTEFADCFTSGANWGFSRFAISEHSLNNDEGAPVNKIIEWWETEFKPWIRNKDLVYYAFYNSSGPASGTNAYLDTPEELEMFGNLCVEYKYG